METRTARRPAALWIVGAGLAGLALGSYGIANAAGGSGSPAGGANAAGTAAGTNPAAPSPRHARGGQRPTVYVNEQFQVVGSEER